MTDQTLLALVKLFGRKGGEVGLGEDAWKRLDAWLSLECAARGMGDDWMDVFYDRCMATDDQWKTYYAALGMEMRIKPLDGGGRMVSWHEIGGAS